MRPQSTTSMLVGLLLSGLVSSAAVSSPRGDITPRADSIGLTPLTFNLDEISVAPGQAVYDCDPDEEGCKEKAKLLARASPPTRSICPSDQRYTKSECMKSNIIKVYCQDSNGRVWPKWRVCEKTEICVQNDQNPPYATCKPVIDLVLWYTNSAGGSTVSEKYVHSNKKQSTSKVGNMYFDRNGNYIKLFQTDFYREPGNYFIGETIDGNRAYSQSVNWANTENVKIDVKTGGDGGISVYTFLT
ncbi:secreted in xylem 6 [Fusarium pseudoanthophilum]|uniref:Secreted in xylem 6 n=1 Tax=Fusarium pseudoanthophilum TaxID=48495 RepID=A0A8H5LDB1_9HYPO|nr:secreted in xylem 6 [Fusarium pseudoanthophilum]